MLNDGRKTYQLTKLDQDNAGIRSGQMAQETLYIYIYTYIHTCVYIYIYMCIYICTTKVDKDPRNPATDSDI